MLRIYGSQIIPLASLAKDRSRLPPLLSLPGGITALVKKFLQAPKANDQAH